AKAGKANRCETTPILQYQSFFCENTAQINFHAAVTTVDVVFIDCRSSRGGQFLGKIGGGTHPKSGDILLAISIDRVRTDFFRSRDVRTGHDHFLDGDARPISGLRRRRCFLTESNRDRKQESSCHPNPFSPNKWSIYYTAFRLFSVV